MIFTFAEIQLPTNYDYGSRTGPSANSMVFNADSGWDVRTARWGQTKGKFTIDYSVKNPAQLAQLKAFYMCRCGMTIPFRFKDLYDFTSAADGQSAFTMLDQPILQDTGGNWRLAKMYGTQTRWILKPVLNVSATSATIGSGGGGYAVNDIITLVGGTHTIAATFKVTAVSSGVVSTVSVVNGGSYTTTLPSNPVATTGGTGSGATITVSWNGTKVVIAVSGTLYTSATVDYTTGIVTGLPGSGTFTAGFQFDTPARFDSVLEIESTDSFIGAVKSLNLQEIIYPVPNV